MRTMAQVRQALSSLSGFPEWLPAGHIVEQHFVDILRRTFELHGFSGIQTRAVEPLSELTKKGETSKEVYLLSRLQADPADAESETDPRKQLGLHFDLTVPFARYVVDNAGLLTFPFKRYQIQKVWRGERPQEGRFREFIQADIDIVGDGALPLHHDVEVPLIMHEALSALPVPAVTIHVSNRKVAQGFYQSIGIDTDRLIEVLRVVDKLDKIGPEKVAAELTQSVGTSAQQAAQALRLATITGTDGQDVSDQVLRALAGAEPTELLIEGLAELTALLEATGRRRPGAVIADLKIARGLDYYTKTAFEFVTTKIGAQGTVCGGGRYDHLVEEIGGPETPGVGFGLGKERLLLTMEACGAEIPQPAGADVFIAVMGDNAKAAGLKLMHELRQEGVCVQMDIMGRKIKNQFKYADRIHAEKTIVIGDDELANNSVQLKDMTTSEQTMVPLDRIVEILTEEEK